MNTHADKTQENKSQSVSAANSQKKSSGESTFQFVDNRPESIAQRKLQEMANNSPQIKKAGQLQAKENNHSTQHQQPIQKKENNTGLPDNLKTGIKNLSGYSMDDVKVHYNSDKPTQLNAHAYAQGSDIHVASGQEKHLPHEAWHVVQQKQGRVKPTMQMKGQVNINDDAGLEKEADVMGAKAFQFVGDESERVTQRKQQKVANGSIIQRAWDGNEEVRIRNWDEILPPGLQWHWNNQTGKMYYTIPQKESAEDSEDIKRLRERQNEEYYYQEWIKAGWPGLGPIPKAEEVVEEEEELVFAGALEGKNIDDVIGLLEENYTNVKIAAKIFLRTGKLGKKKYTNLHDVASKLVQEGVPIAIKQDVVLNFGEGDVFVEEDLRVVLRPLYNEGGKPSKTQMLDAIRNLYKSESIDEIVQSKDFVYGLQKIVREMVTSQGGQPDFLENTKITDLPEDEIEVEDVGTYQMQDISKWTLRHYSAKGTDEVPPTFNDVKSAVALGVKDTSRDTSGGHTGQVDWRKYGNVGNTFYLLYIDSQVVQKQKFLDNAKWYCEFKLSEIPSLWISSDWLDESGIKGEAIRGSGKNVQKKLLTLGGKGDGAQFIAQLSALYHNFEVKIPGSIRISEWKKA